MDSSIIPLGTLALVFLLTAARQGNQTLTFLEFVRIGVPLTLLNGLVYWGFLSIL